MRRCPLVILALSSSMVYSTASRKKNTLSNPKFWRKLGSFPRQLPYFPGRHGNGPPPADSFPLCSVQSLSIGSPLLLRLSSLPEWPTFRQMLIKTPRSRWSTSSRSPATISASAWSQNVLFRPNFSRNLRSRQPLSPSLIRS